LSIQKPSIFTSCSGNSSDITCSPVPPIVKLPLGIQTMSPVSGLFARRSAWC
jgi:hypothetical protein